MKTYTRFISVILFSFLLQTTHAQNNALSFDGTNDYVDCGNSSALNANTIRTMECWVKFNSFSGTQEILSKSSNSSGIEILVISNTLCVYCMNSSEDGSYITYPTSSLLTGVWYHVAMTWNGTKEGMKLYINGVSVGTRTDIGNINFPGLTNPGTFKIGNWSDSPSRFFSGCIDEVKIWNVTRSALQIKLGMYGIALNTTGLVAYYKVNTGSGTTLINATATTGLNGTLTNGPTWIASPVQAISNGLNFDGINDQVVVPANSVFDLNSGTIECWVRPSVLVGNACILGNRGTGGARFSFHMSTVTNTIGLWDGSVYTTIPYTITAGTWYHLAFVCNGTNTLVYVNGTLAGTIAKKFSTVTGQTFVIGIAKNSGGDGEPFLGDIDEVRVWNTMRTQAEIQANKDVTLTGTESGLVALYSFDQGTNGGTNTGLTIATDKTSGNNHGQLNGFLMVGITSNWVNHTLITLPVNLSAFTAVKDGKQVRLQWETSQEQNSKEFIIERSFDGSNFSSIGTIAAAGASTSARSYSFNDNNPQAGNNFYRLKQTDIDGKFMYSATRSVNFTSASPKITWYTTGNGQAEVKLVQGSKEKYIVADMNGRIVKQGNLSNGILHISDLPAGSYSVQIETTSGNEGIVVMIR